jgi:hypothetical protein
MTLTLAEATKLDRKGHKTLISDHADFTWQLNIEFEHVSGEYWVLYAEMMKLPGTRVMQEYAAAEFRLGADGKINKLGVEWRDVASGVIDGWIWYHRVTE